MEGAGPGWKGQGLGERGGTWVKCVGPGWKGAGPEWKGGGSWWRGGWEPLNEKPSGPSPLLRSFCILLFSGKLNRKKCVL